MNIGIPNALASLLSAWKAPQVKLPKVLRWKKYIEHDCGARPQDSLQHSHAITILGGIVATQLRPYIELDGSLLLTALAIHDVGEGEIGHDTHYIDKSTGGDLAEYEGFRARYEPLGPDVFATLHSAFLLQFALRNPDVFPQDARDLMTRVATEFEMEALAFDAIERWDYVLYALEQYHERGNERILVQTLRNQIPHLDRLTRSLPGFGETIWTIELSSWARDFVQSCDGRWCEQKGEL